MTDNLTVSYALLSKESNDYADCCLGKGDNFATGVSPCGLVSNRLYNCPKYMMDRCSKNWDQKCDNYLDQIEPKKEFLTQILHTKSCVLNNPEYCDSEGIPKRPLKPGEFCINKVLDYLDYNSPDSSFFTYSNYIMTPAIDGNLINYNINDYNVLNPIPAPIELLVKTKDTPAMDMCMLNKGMNIDDNTKMIIKKCIDYGTCADTLQSMCLSDAKNLPELQTYCKMISDLKQLNKEQNETNDKKSNTLKSVPPQKFKSEGMTGDNKNTQSPSQNNYYYIVIPIVVGIILTIVAKYYLSSK